MEKSILAMTAAALVAGGLQAKGRDPGPPDQRQVKPGDFDRIAIAGPFRVIVRTGKEARISLSGPRTMLDDTELFVRDGQLIVRWQEGASWSRNGDHGVDLDIEVPALREAMMAGAGSIEIDRIDSDNFAAMLIESGVVTIGAAEVKQFNAQLAGSGGLSVGWIDAESVDVSLVGSGGMRAQGKARAMALNVTGSASFNNPDFTAREARIMQGGSGTVRATVTNIADIKVVGSGDIELSGGAKCNVSKAGSGDVRCG